MRHKLKILFLNILFSPFLIIGNIEQNALSDIHLFKKTAISKHHISYLMQKKKIVEALDLYKGYRKQLGRHDFELLEQLGMILLDEGARSNDMEKQILSIFGAGIAKIFNQIEILEAGILSPHPEIQIASVQALTQLQDDRSEELLTRAMASEFLYTRIQAAYGLATRKARTAVGQIEALMYRLPHEMRSFFPQLFALLGTADAMLVLRGLIDDPYVHVKVAAILSAAGHGRDDLLPLIRTIATHSHPAELESAVFALGKLKDSKSLNKLQKLSSSSFPHVQIAALRSLYELGELSAKNRLEKIALEENVFAIAALGGIQGSEEILAKLLNSNLEQVRINAAISLLQLRDSRCVRPIFDLLIRDGRDLGLSVQYSFGSSLMAFKQVPLVRQKELEGIMDLYSLSLSIREQLLQDCLELREEDFLEIAKGIFQSKQTELIPLLTTLLENLATNGAIDLLRSRAESAGAPLIRTYCSLALYRMHKAGPYEERLWEWIRSTQVQEMIRFRPISIKQKKLDGNPFEITPEEGSLLLIQAYEALAQKHEAASLELLLEGIKNGHPNNRYILAGLLLHSIQ